MIPRFENKPFLQWLDRTTRWPKALRSMGNSLAARLTIIVPLLGYLILLNDHLVQALKMHTSLCVGRACDTPLRLQLLYLGGSLYGVATAIYTLACPYVIQRFADASEYFRAQGQYFGNWYNLKFLSDEVEKAGGTTRSWHAPTAANSEVHADIMAEHYVVLSYSAFPARLIAFVLFLMGLVLVAIPSVWTFYEVLRAVIVSQFGT